MTIEEVLRLIAEMKLKCAPSIAGTGRWKGLDDLEKRILNEATRSST